MSVGTDQQAPRLSRPTRSDDVQSVQLLQSALYGSKAATGATEPAGERELFARTSGRRRSHGAGEHDAASLWASLRVCAGAPPAARSGVARRSSHSVGLLTGTLRSARLAVQRLRKFAPLAPGPS